MTPAVIRKTRRFVEDPVLRQWIWNVALGRRARRPPFEMHRPHYLTEGTFDCIGQRPSPETVASFRSLFADTPREPITLKLPGQDVMLSPGEASRFFERKFADTETQLAAYRFSWLPLEGERADPAWVAELWSAFTRRFAEPDDSWAWHPYTAAERAINILDYARRHGLPGQRDETLIQIAQHASVIARRLEYFGDYNTSNHLANNGRGLYRIGLALKLPGAIETGKDILLNEADRIFRPSGVLREGSSHYHLLLVRNYADAFLAALAHDRPEAGRLRDIVARGLAVLARLVLPGGLPLIGDISPDCPPDFLACLLVDGPLDTGWGAILAPDERAALNKLHLALPHISDTQLAADGWVRLATGKWTALCHAAPDGWAPMPGHAHQDIGSFEVHWEAMPLFVDPGRGSYDEGGEGGLYISAAAHNGLTIDGHDPYPPNKPYYDDAFRCGIGGPPPRVTRQQDGVSITFGGFGRFSDLGETRRDITFQASSLTVADSVKGKGRHHVVRRLHTIWPTDFDGNRAIVHTPSGDFQIQSDHPLSVRACKRWTAYGVWARAWAVESEAQIEFPARLELRVERSTFSS